MLVVSDNYQNDVKAVVIYLSNNRHTIVPEGHGTCPLNPLCLSYLMHLDTKKERNYTIKFLFKTESSYL